MPAGTDDGRMTVDVFGYGLAENEGEGYPGPDGTYEERVMGEERLVAPVLSGIGTVPVPTKYGGVTVDEFP